jgi:diguanylate cyclase (GGDEF)-like protein/PAS domain S-box-containing protein
MFVENMRDGAASVSESGIVLYANPGLAELLALSVQQIIGSPITSLIADHNVSALQAISRRGAGGMIETDLLGKDGMRIPVRVSTSTLDVDSRELLCMTFADLTQQHAKRREIDGLGLAQAERMRELERAQAVLTEQATHDALTGLPDRNLLIARLIQALELAKRLGKSTGLIFVDLDRFKGINDTSGHAAGDSVLREIAKRLVTAVRPMDTVCRLGGDEFVVLLPALQSALDAVDLATRVAAVTDAPIMLDDRLVPVTASIGISVSDPALSESDPDPDTMLQQADSAMYHAKARGGSRTEFFAIGRTPTVVQADRKMWIARIREALDKDRFVLHAQPIVELSGGAVVKQELLLRMRDHDGQLIAPLAFLPTAERCGLIGEIDQWVIAQATSLAAGGKMVGVNLSATSAGDPRVLDLIKRELCRHQADPRNLMFEITETAVIQNIDRARLFAEHLGALGCQFALDDFGTGFASFTYLKQLPVHYLKIDIDFVRDLYHNQRDMLVVRAIVALARDFGQQTIAEGVEDEQTADLLRELGVTFAQGYLFGRPGPITEHVPFLTRRS